MTEPLTGAGEEQRVEELLRVNAALAAEIRDLLAGRIEAPRAAPMPAARRLATLTAERDAAREEGDSVRAALVESEKERAELLRQRDALRAEVARLRGGPRGALRRLRARLLRLR